MSLFINKTESISLVKFKYIPLRGSILISGSKDFEKLRLYSSRPEKTERIVRKEKYAMDKTKIEKLEIIDTIP
tara:strand:+ start:352 stop:570 length:219 start_codon:yes stop_codon:yes gene_type:complete